MGRAETERSFDFANRTMDSAERHPNQWILGRLLLLENSKYNGTLAGAPRFCPTKLRADAIASD
jgi:hypothetical protein